MNRGRPLFSSGRIEDYLEIKKRQIKWNIEHQDKNYLLNVNEAEFIEYLASEYSIEPLVIYEKDITIENKSEIGNRGLEITFAIPFHGKEELFNYTPTPYTYSRPRGEIGAKEILITVQTLEYDEEEVKKTLNDEAKKIKEYLGWMKQNIESFNNSLEPFIRGEIRTRKQKVQKDIKMIEQLGFPLKRRNDIPKTFVIPEIRKKTKIKKPKAVKKLDKPEPILEMENYEDILNILQSMNLVIERSPKTFSKLQEEELRDIFLVILNSHYEGQATGETFNYSGKTDILIRYEGKNVFIAECKFWRGKKHFLEAIDQLLGYKCWRDTKTAILLLNRGQNFSDVLVKIPEITINHSCFKKVLEKSEETVFKYIFHHKGDVDREFFLTVMAFDIPKL